MPARPSASAEARRVSLASAIGTTIEWYDFFIYGIAAATVFGPQFFPQVSELAGTLASFATFGIGFIAGRWAAWSWAITATAWGASSCWCGRCC